MFTKRLLSFIHSYINYANIARVALIKLNSKYYLGNKNNLRVLYMIKIDLRMPKHYLRLYMH